MPPRARPALLLLLLPLWLACGGAPGPERAPRSDARLITSEELRESRARNAMEAVQFLRPGWLRRQGAYSFRDDGDIVVYLDDTRLGGPESLRTIEVQAVFSIRWLDPVAAQARYGLSHNYGAIRVSTEPTG